MDAHDAFSPESTNVFGDECGLTPQEYARRFEPSVATVVNSPLSANHDIHSPPSPITHTVTHSVAYQRRLNWALFWLSTALVGGTITIAWAMENMPISWLTGGGL